MPTNTTSRLKRLRQSLDSAGAGALLETHLPNIYYLCGFSGDSGALQDARRWAESVRLEDAVINTALARKP